MSEWADAAGKARLEGVVIPGGDEALLYSDIEIIQSCIASSRVGSSPCTFLRESQPTISHRTLCKARIVAARLWVPIHFAEQSELRSVCK